MHFGLVAVLIKGGLDKDIEVFSVIDIDYDTFCKWEGVTPFYQNLIKEGIVLWEAA